MINLLKYELMSRRVGIIGWGIGLVLFGSMYIFIYPEFSEQMEALAGISIYEAMGIDMTSFAGYISSVVVQYVPIILGVYAVAASTGTLAGEEDRGTLELILTTPLKRWQILTTKVIAISIAMLLIIAIAGIGDAISLMIIKNTVDVDVSFTQLFVAVLNAFPITFAFAMIGIFMGSFLPNRRTAVSVMAVVYIASYFMEILFSLVDSLEALKPISLFYFFDTTAQVFWEGINLGDVAVLLSVAMLFFALALMSFQRRDITVGRWFWQRSMIQTTQES